MKGNKLYVGNLSDSVTTDQLQDLFSDYGEVRNVRIIVGQGFGFVEMSNSFEAKSAKETLDESDFEGNTLKIEEAHPPKKRKNRNYKNNVYTLNKY